MTLQVGSPALRQILYPWLHGIAQRDFYHEAALWAFRCAKQRHDEGKQGYATFKDYRSMKRFTGARFSGEWFLYDVERYLGDSAEALQGLLRIHARWRWKDATDGSACPRGNVWLAFQALLDAGAHKAAYAFASGGVA